MPLSLGNDFCLSVEPTFGTVALENIATQEALLFHILLNLRFEESPVKMDDVFSSPWCCDSVYEDRYIHLLNVVHEVSQCCP